MALVAWALAGMPAQTRGSMPLAPHSSILGMAGTGRLGHHVGELLAYLGPNGGALVHYAPRRRNRA